MKIGAPIITTKAGGNPETIKNGQTGLLVNFNNKEQWQKVIFTILDQPQLANEIAEKAKQDLNRFSWPNLVNETIIILKNL